MPVLYTSRRSFRTHCVLVTRIYIYRATAWGRVSDSISQIVRYTICLLPTFLQFQEGVGVICGTGPLKSGTGL